MITQELKLASALKAKNSNATDKTQASINTSAATALKVGEVAQLLRCHPSTIYRMLRRGELKGFKVGSDWRFLHSEVERFIDRASTIANG